MSDSISASVPEPTPIGVLDTTVVRELLLELGHVGAEDELAGVGDLGKRGAEIREVGLIVLF